MHANLKKSRLIFHSAVTFFGGLSLVAAHNKIKSRDTQFKGWKWQHHRTCHGWRCRIFNSFSFSYYFVFHSFSSGSVFDFLAARIKNHCPLFALTSKIPCTFYCYKILVWVFMRLIDKLGCCLALRQHQLRFKFINMRPRNMKVKWKWKMEKVLVPRDTHNANICCQAHFVWLNGD